MPETERKPWTDAQRAAITARGTSTLVSAAAGSGKTSVLVERVMRRVLDPESGTGVDRLLVVTFTDAAAGGMRAGLATGLEAALAREPTNRHAYQQLTLLARASISTLHAYCLRLVREHFHRVDLDPEMKVMGEHEATLTLADSLEDLFTARHAAEAPRFLRLVESYGGGEAPVTLKRVVSELHGFVRSLARPDDWLAEAVARYAAPARDGIAALDYWEPLLRWIAVELARARAELAALGLATTRPGAPAVYRRRLDADVEMLRATAERVAQAASWSDVAAALAAVSFERLDQAKGFEASVKKPFSKARGAVKARIGALCAQLTDRSEGEWLAELNALAPHVEELAALVRDLDERYTRAKRRRAALDFNDLEHLALEILGEWDASRRVFTPTEVAHEQRARFDEVLVDEYQDVNDVQEAILALVGSTDSPPGRAGARPPFADELPPEGGPTPEVPRVVSGNRFVVGDVKQSIYGFRHTDPAVFRRKQLAYAGGRGGRAIVLAENFRSREPIVDGVNFLFRQVMSESLGGIAYDADAELRYGAGYPTPDDGSSGDAPVELHLVERTVPPFDVEGEDDGTPGDGERNGASGGSRWLEDASAAEKEAIVAARAARRIVEGDPAAGLAPARVATREAARGAWTTRPATWGDVVILLRSAKTKASAFADVLTACGIPAHSSAGAGWLSVTEIETMLALLGVLENPRQDVALAAVLLSPIGGFRAAELARMRLADRRGALLDALRASTSDERVPEELRRRLDAFRARLESWRTAARRAPLSRLVWRIYGESRFLDVASAMPGGEQRRANLLALHDRAREFDHFARQGLARFLAFIERLRAESEELGTAPAFGAGENVVRVLTIHKAKGLEFPFVIAADLGKEWNERELTGDVLRHRDLHLGLRVVDLELRAKYPSLAYHAVRAAGRASLRAEELRVLYVALTRARERLILIGSARELSVACARWTAWVAEPGRTLPESAIAGAERALDWIVPAVARHPDGEPIRRAVRGDDGPEAASGVPSSLAGDPSRWSVHLWKGAELEAAAAAQSGRKVRRDVDWAGIARLDPAAFGAERGDGFAAEREHLAARFAWRDPLAPIRGRFAKMSVTELKARFAARSPSDADAVDVDAATLRWADTPPPKRAKRPQGAPRAPARAKQAAGAAVSPPFFTERPRFLDGPAQFGVGAGPVPARPTVATAGGDKPRPYTPELPGLFAAPAPVASGPLRPDATATPAAVDIGIATHLVLRHLDFTKPTDPASIRTAVAELVVRALLSPEQAAAARIDSIAAFLGSDLGRRIAAAPERIRREVPFTLGLPAGEIHDDLEGDAANDTVVVQGVIDLLVEDPEGSGFWLLDYKTDAVRAGDIDTVAQRYRGQMALYARAVREIYRRPVTQSWLCFLGAGTAVRV